MTGQGAKRMEIADRGGALFRVVVVADLDGMLGAVGIGVVYVEDTGSVEGNLARAREVLLPDEHEG
jgi:hypothetical protein